MMIEEATAHWYAETAQPVAVTYAEAARMLSVSERTVRRLTASGQLRAVEVGGPQTKRILLDDLMDYAANLSGDTPHANP